MNIINKSKTALCQQIPISYESVRHRMVVDPGSLKERLFRAVTKPVLVINEEKTVKGHLLNSKKKIPNYMEYLIRDCRKNLIEPARGHMLLVFHLNHFKMRENQDANNHLFFNNLKFFYTPNRIVREAAKDTELEQFVDKLYPGNSFNLSVIGDGLPQSCAAAVTVEKKARAMFLMGGLLEYRSMNAAQVRAYASLGDRDAVLANLLGTLQAGQCETVRLLEQGQQTLSWALSEVAQRHDK